MGSKGRELCLEPDFPDSTVPGWLKPDLACADFSFQHTQFQPLPSSTAPFRTSPDLWVACPLPKASRKSHPLPVMEPLTSPRSLAGASGQGDAEALRPPPALATQREDRQHFAFAQALPRQVLAALRLEETSQHGDTHFVQEAKPQAAAVAAGCKRSLSSALVPAAIRIPTG